MDWDYADSWEPNWCGFCGNIAVSVPGALCDMCINAAEESHENRHTPRPAPAHRQ